MKRGILKDTNFKKYIFLVVTFSTGHLNLFSQFPGCPAIDAGPDQTLPCTANCIDLIATPFHTGLTTTYTASSIPHNPPIAYNAPGGNPVSVGLDDIWSEPINIPFNFCYFGQSYNVLNVGSNGSLNLGPGTPVGTFQPYSINTPCPSFSLVDGGEIYGVYHDIDPTVNGTVTWYLLGTAPCRIFVVVYNDLGHFLCNSLRSTSMIVLYETTNVIDVYVQQKETCNLWNGGNAIIGIQNSSGSNGLTAPGRNSTSNWTVSTPEAWRFRPNGPINYSIKWYVGATQIGTGPTLNVCPTTTTTYSVECTYTMCNGSTVVETDLVNIQVDGFPNAGTDSSLTICEFAAPINLFTFLGPNVSTPGVWTNPIGQVVTMPYDPISMNPGVYTYSVDSNGCVKTAEITVLEINTTVSTIITPPSCIGENDAAVSVSFTNGQSYSLNGNPFLPVTTSPFQINNLVQGNYSLIINGTVGCTATTNFVISDPNPLQINSVTQSDTICPDFDYSLVATVSGGSSAYTFTWYGSDGTINIGNPVTVSPSSSTTYLLVLTETCGSTPDSASLTLTTLESAAIIVIPDDINGCVPHLVNFSNNTSNATIISSVIDFGDGSSTTAFGLASFSHLYTKPGVFSVKITSTNDLGCVFTKVYTDTIEVYSLPDPSFIINPNPVSFYYPMINLVKNNPNALDIYDWTIWGGIPSTSNSSHFEVNFPEEKVGNYPVSIIVENQYGCIDSLTQIVQVVSEVIFYAPNTFTPDGDEFNNTWRIHIEGIDPFNFELLVFNRWGEIVWESQDSKVTWDGIYKGKPIQEGTYTWIIRCKDATNDKKYTFEGHVNVLR